MEFEAGPRTQLRAHLTCATPTKAPRDWSKTFSRTFFRFFIRSRPRHATSGLSLPLYRRNTSDVQLCTSIRKVGLDDDLRGDEDRRQRVSRRPRRRREG